MTRTQPTPSAASSRRAARAREVHVGRRERGVELDDLLHESVTVREAVFLDRLPAVTWTATTRCTRRAPSPSTKVITAASTGTISRETSTSARNTSSGVFVRLSASMAS